MTTVPEPRTRTVITTSGKPGMTMATIEEVELLSAPAIPGLGASPETRGRIAREMRAMADRVEAGEVVSLEYFNGRHSSEGPAQWSVTIGL